MRNVQSEHDLNSRPLPNGVDPCLCARGPICSAIYSGLPYLACARVAGAWSSLRQRKVVVSPLRCRVFTVSFFWPVALTSQRRRCRRRRRKPKPQQVPKYVNSDCDHQQLSDIPSAAALPASASPSLSQIVPAIAHHPLPSAVTSFPVAPTSKLEVSPELADSSATDNVSVESIAIRSPNCDVSLETADPLQHLDDADSVEFEVKDEEPVVKHTIKGKVGWTPIRVTNRYSTEGEEYGVDYLKKCKKISILCNEDSGWQASIRCGSAWFSTPIAARTRSRTSRDIT